MTLQLFVALLWRNRDTTALRTFWKIMMFCYVSNPSVDYNPSLAYVITSWHSQFFSASLYLQCCTCHRMIHLIKLLSIYPSTIHANVLVSKHKLHVASLEGCGERLHHQKHLTKRSIIVFGILCKMRGMWTRHVRDDDEDWLLSSYSMPEQAKGAICNVSSPSCFPHICFLPSRRPCTLFI